jgi:hypothetical protein
MRVTITFFLVACILGLTIWAWILTPARIESLSILAGNRQYNDIKKINDLTDIRLLKAHAISLLYTTDERAIERDELTARASNILATAVLIALITQVLLFREIASRGKDYRKQKL